MSNHSIGFLLYNKPEKIISVSFLKDLHAFKLKKRQKILDFPMQ
jgi:hypothetical protein